MYDAHVCLSVPRTLSDHRRKPQQQPVFCDHTLCSGYRNWAVKRPSCDVLAPLRTLSAGRALAARSIRRTCEEEAFDILPPLNPSDGGRRPFTIPPSCTPGCYLPPLGSRYSTPPGGTVLPMDLF